MATLKGLFRHRGGATAALVALSTTTLVGGVGFAVDWGMVQVSETRLQNAADAAATAAARNMASDTSAGGCLPDTSFVSPALPNRTSVVTQGNPCTAESGWTGTCYFATPQGNPIVRIDSAYNGPATVTFSLASPARTFTFNAPQRGSFYYVVPGFTLPNTGSTTMVFRIVSSTPTATISGGTATYVNRFNTTATLPGTCVQSTSGGTTKAALVR